MKIKTVLSYVRHLVGSRNTLRGQLVRGGVGSALIQVINRFMSLALGIVLARGLGAEGYGIYVYAFAIMTLLMVFAELGMPTLLIREVAANHARQDWSQLRGVLVRAFQIVILSSMALVGIAVLILWLLSDYMPVSQSNTIIWMIAIIPFAALTKVMFAALQGLHHVLKAQSVELLVRPFLVLLGIGSAFVFYPNMRIPQYAVAIQLGAVIAMLCVTSILLYRCLPRSVYITASRYNTRQWLSSAKSLTLIGGAGIINSQTDILMLAYFISPTDVGVYRIAVQGALLIGFGLQAANIVIAPQFARLYEQGDYARLQLLVTKSARVILLIALPFALSLILAGGVIVGWVFGHEFADAHLPIAILAVGQLVNASMGSVGVLLNMTRHEKDVARTLLITGVLNIFLNLFLIPLFGVAGAAIATSISQVLWNIILYRIVKKRLGIYSTALYLK